MRRFRKGEDLRYLPLADRKLRLHAVVPNEGERLLFCDHIDTHGKELFRLACERDLEGIVAKRKSDPYLPDHAAWLKIRNQGYSQWIGHEELFERERGRDPDFQVWDGCALACTESAPDTADSVVTREQRQTATGQTTSSIEACGRLDEIPVLTR